MPNALKAVQKTDDQLIVENHIVLFGGRDLEGHVTPRINRDGSLGEYFDKAVDVRSPYTNLGRFFVGWDHGNAQDGEPGKHDVLGYVDWSTARKDKAGILVQRILDRRNWYVKEIIEPLVEAGLIGTSSEAIDEAVEKKADGGITRWPLRGDTLTVTPMEPRMLGENQLAKIKAVTDKHPSIKAAIFGPSNKAALFDVSGHERSGVMVALFPPPDVARKIAVRESGEPVEDLHMTLAYYGGADGLTSAQIATIVRTVEMLSMEHGPVMATLGGIGRFAASETSDGQDVFYASVDSPVVESLRRSLCMADYRVAPVRSHGFTPHISLAYIDPDDELPVTKWMPLDVTFDRISIVVGDRREDFPFSAENWVNAVEQKATVDIVQEQEDSTDPQAESPEGASAAPATADGSNAAALLDLELELLSMEISR